MDNQYIRILGARTVKAMKDYPGWADLPPGTEVAWRRYIQQSPTILIDRLNNQIVLTELLAAKLQWIEFLIQKSILRKIYGVYQHQERQRIAGSVNLQMALTEIGSPELPNALRRIHDQSDFANTTLHTPTIERVPANTTELFLLENLGLAGSARHAYQIGKLTVEELLKTQPWLILSV